MYNFSSLFLAYLAFDGILNFSSPKLDKAPKISI